MSLNTHVRHSINRSCRQNVVLFDVMASNIHGYVCAIKVNIHTYCDSGIRSMPHVYHFYLSICLQLQEPFSLDGKVTRSLKLADTEFSSGQICTVTGWGTTEEVRVQYKIIYILHNFFLWLCDPTRVMASSFLMFLNHTQWRSTVGRTSLDEWSARLRGLYLTTHDSHNRQTSMPPVGFELTISVGERPQSYALDRAATETGKFYTINKSFFKLLKYIEGCEFYLSQSILQ